MKAKPIAAGFLVILLLAEVCVLYAQHGEITGLRADQEERLAALQSTGETGTAPPAAPASDNSSLRIEVTPELLRLRGEVTRLEARRRELAAVVAQNAELRAQAARQNTNATAGILLPPGYVRKSEARLVGYGSPADTIQSLVWAIRNKSSTHFLQAFSPEIARKFQTNGLSEQIFRDADQLPGMGLVETRPMQDGSVEGKIEVVPGMPGQPMKFQQIQGEWKIATDL